MSDQVFAIAIVVVTIAGSISFIRGWVLTRRYLAKERAARKAAAKNNQS
ncbi:MAG: hypothetical protein AAFV45_14515 [Pseudomonadota bacterium]